ncbi:MAG: squalene synthase HpnC [bacterium]|nr:squalene synthase HpnC [bacterium]
MEQQSNLELQLGGPSVSLEEAYAYCEKLTRSHYENFPVGSLLVPRRIRPHVHAIYAFARLADDMADEPGLNPDERLEQLEVWEALLDKCRREPTGPVFTALGHTLVSQQLPIQLLRDLLTAFRLDVSRNRHESLEALRDYCIFSAHPIGRLMLHLFGYRSDEAGRQSDAICAALQLANFWQDIAVDYGRDRIYLPQREMAGFGIGEETLKNGQATPGFRHLLAHLVSHTQELFDEGRPLLLTVRGRLRYELRVTWLGGVEILRKLAQCDYDVFHHRPHIGKGDLPRLLCRALWPVGWHPS